MYQNVLAWRIAKRLFVLQSFVTVLVTALAWSLGDIKAAYSAFLGGVVCVIPAQVFAYCLLKYSGAQESKRIVRGLFAGEIAKIVLSILLFAMVFVMFEISPLIFFMTFILVQLVNWFSPLLLRDELEHEHNHNSDSE